MIKIINGDALFTLKKMKDNSIDLVVTSPPYNLGNFSKGSFYHGKKKGSKLEYLSHNDNMNDENYKIWQHNILKECYRLLKKTGAIFYNHKPRINKGIYDNRRNLIPFPIRQEIIWNRCSMVNFSGSFYAPNTERLFIIAKNEWKPVKKYLSYGEVWKVSPELNTLHPAPFPLKLIKKIVVSASNSGNMVLDPFMGSGTTAIACKELCRSFIGIEKEKKYCDIANKRIRHALDGKGLKRWIK